MREYVGSLLAGEAPKASVGALSRWVRRVPARERHAHLQPRDLGALARRTLSDAAGVAGGVAPALEELPGAGRPERAATRGRRAGGQARHAAAEAAHGSVIG